MATGLDEQCYLGIKQDYDTVVGKEGIQASPHRGTRRKIEEAKALKVYSKTTVII